jgi:hypothetical protein
MFCRPDKNIGLLSEFAAAGAASTACHAVVCLSVCTCAVCARVACRLFGKVRCLIWYSTLLDAAASHHSAADLWQPLQVFYAVCAVGTGWNALEWLPATSQLGLLGGPFCGTTRLSVQCVTSAAAPGPPAVTCLSRVDD